MMERYGIFYNPDGSLDHFDAQRSFEEVRHNLAQAFSFQPKGAIVEFTAPGGIGTTMRSLLAQRGINQEVIETSVNRIAEATDIGGAAAYAGDLDLDISPKPQYIIFMSTASKIIEFPIFLAEEVTHGEHMATIIQQESITYEEYQNNRFHEISEEFLGYLGRKRILEILDFKGSYNPNIDASKNLTRSYWAHMLAYYMVDDLLEKGKVLPLAQLFHAATEEEMWHILQETTQEPFQLTLNFGTNIDFDNLMEPLNELIAENKANDYIKLTFRRLDKPEEEQGVN